MAKQKGWTNSIPVQERTFLTQGIYVTIRSILDKMKSIQRSYSL